MLYCRYQEDKDAVFDLQIAGFIYTIDLKKMEQYRKEDRNISRGIKRDLVKHVEVKGNAGLLLDNLNSQNEGRGSGLAATVRRTASPTPRHESHRQGLDISQLVAELNLTATHDSSDDDAEPESLV